MNQRYCVCRSVLRRNPFTRWSSKPISSSCSSLISNNPTSSILVSKYLHTFNYPPQIFLTSGNHFRKFSGQAAEKCNFEENYLKEEKSKVHSAVIDAWMHIELGTLPPLDAAKIPADQFNAFKQKFDLDNGDYSHHLQRYGEEIVEEIEMLEDSVKQGVAYGKYADAGGKLGYHFKDWYNDVGRFQGEGSESENESDTLPTAQDDESSAVVAQNLTDNTNQIS
ncbi:uncharacterized protein LOC113293377 [Papaver somniferum]|uniref:uncharacterized protein LOC113293377 n=1 Tax=Papaver somniferum TaxID=3469 RepID=UPI000E6F7B81|nr:uncharacterized protein LOC113293377 [Papaver somniferum]